MDLPITKNWKISKLKIFFENEDSFETLQLQDFRNMQDIQNHFGF